jgi:hypothetical protein
MRFIALIAIGVVLGCASSPDPARAPSLLEEALAWLPGDTETLIVAQGPFTIEDGESLESITRQLASAPLAAVREGRFAKALEGRTLKLALQGSRNFRRPRGLGMFRYHGAGVLVFPDGAALDGVAKEIEAAAEERREERGHAVSVFHELLEQDEWTFLVARPRPDVLVCATDRNYLCELLDRMAKPSGTRALPADLPEWKLLDPRATCWAVRHYDRRKEQDFYAESFPDDKSAQGLVFFVAPDGGAARVRALSESHDTFHKFEAFDRPTDNLSAKLEHEGGIIEVTATCESPQVAAMFYLVLLNFLGHAVFL